MTTLYPFTPYSIVITDVICTESENFAIDFCYGTVTWLGFRLIFLFMTYVLFSICPQTFQGPKSVIRLTSSENKGQKWSFIVTRYRLTNTKKKVLRENIQWKSTKITRLETMRGSSRENTNTHSLDKHFSILVSKNTNQFFALLFKIFC